MVIIANRDSFAPDDAITKKVLTEMRHEEKIFFNVYLDDLNRQLRHIETPNGAWLTRLLSQQTVESAATLYPMPNCRQPRHST